MYEKCLYYVFELTKSYWQKGFLKMESSGKQPKQVSLCLSFFVLIVSLIFVGIIVRTCTGVDERYGPPNTCHKVENGHKEVSYLKSEFNKYYKELDVADTKYRRVKYLYDRGLTGKIELTQAKEYKNKISSYLYLDLLPCIEYKKSKQSSVQISNPIPQNDSSKNSYVPSYTIIEKKDISLAGEKRFTYRIVPKDLRGGKGMKDNVEILLKKIIKDLDHAHSTEVTIWLYSSKELSDSVFDIAMAEHRNGAFQKIEHGINPIKTYENNSVQEFKLPQKCLQAFKKYKHCFEKKMCDHYVKINKTEVHKLGVSDFDLEADISCTKSANLLKVCFQDKENVSKAGLLLSSKKRAILQALPCIH